MKYVALLRGINVGGNNKVDMKMLVSSLETAGFSDVSYYLNTGNIFVSSDKTPEQITKLVQKAIKDSSGLDIKVVLRDADTILKLIAQTPSDWANTAEVKCNVMFLWEKYDDPKVLEQLVIREEIDEVFYSPGAIVWRTRQADFNRSGMSKLFGTDLYAHMSIRNINTTRKIAARLAESSS